MFGKDLKWEYHITITTFEDKHYVDIGERMNLGPVLTVDVMTGLANYMELLYDKIFYIEVEFWGAPSPTRTLASIHYDNTGGRWLDFSHFYLNTVPNKRVLGLNCYPPVEV